MEGIGANCSCRSATTAVLLTAARSAVTASLGAVAGVSSSAGAYRTLGLVAAGKAAERAVKIAPGAPGPALGTDLVSMGGAAPGRDGGSQEKGWERRERSAA